MRLLAGSAPTDAGRLDELKALVDSGQIDLRGLQVAVVEGTLVGAALAIVQADGMAFAWPPEAAVPDHLREAVRRCCSPDRARAETADSRPHGNADPDAVKVAQRLFKELGEWLDRESVLYAQILTEPGAEVDPALLRGGGYSRLADLEIRQRSLLLPLPEGRPMDWTIHRFDEERNAARFAAVIEKSYVDSQDCPTFTGHRNGGDALRSHRMSGHFDPERWLLFEKDGADVGVLLLTSHPPEPTWEIVYVGVCPEARGRRLGRQIAFEGLRRAQASGAERLCLCVDSANRFAREIYDELGIVATGQRSVWIRWRGGAAAP